MSVSLIEQLAFHDAADETSFEATELEYEIECYLTGYDIDQIKRMALSYEGQEQWGVFVPKTPQNFSSGSMRVRRTDYPDERHEYTFAVKTNAGDSGKNENQREADEGLFIMFKQLADQGLIKTRYNVPGELANGVKFTWEVDVFYNKMGELVPWLKIDAELPEGEKFTQDQLPFDFDEVLLVSPADKANNTNGINEKVGELYEKYFRSKNVLI